MKIYSISDLHLAISADKPMDVFGKKWNNYIENIKADWQSKVTDEDIVLISGDISWAMKLDDAISDIQSFIDGLKGKKVFIKGNHDYWWQSIGKIRNKGLKDCYFIQNDSVKIGNVIICGSRGWLVEGSPEFKEEDKKYLSRESERMRLALSTTESIKAEDDKLIAMIHYPPFNVKREYTPFIELFEKFGVNAVVYGHLHGSDSRADLKYTRNGISYYLTSCDILDNKLAEIEL